MEKTPQRASNRGKGKGEYYDVGVVCVYTTLFCANIAETPQKKSKKGKGV